MDNQTFTREELYDLVWSQSLLSLSKKYNISDVALRKTCINMDIPLPKAGHWERIKRGSKIEKFSLPHTTLKTQTITFTLRKEGVERSKAPFNKIKQEIEHSGLKLSVPERLTSPDELIIEAKGSLQKKEAKWGRYSGLLSTDRNQLTIRVSKENIKRALLFMDTLIKAIRQRGHLIEIENDASYVVIEGQKIKISCKEKMKRVPIPNSKWPSTELIPTGIITFRMEKLFSETHWQDGKETLEAQIPKIIARLELTGIKLKEEHEKLEIYWAEQRKKRLLAEELQQQKEKDLEGFKEMLEKASRWHKATNLRNYIDAVEQKSMASDSMSEVLKEWLTWARKKADWYDPFVECDDILLNDIDRINLTFKQNSIPKS